jgi:hypothetical protein
MKILNKLKPSFPYLIIIFGIIINVLMWQRYFVPQSDLSGDAHYYHSIAETISQGKTETKNGYDIGAVIMPGYPAIVAGIYTVFGKNVMPVYLIHILTSLSAVLLIYYTIIPLKVR